MSNILHYIINYWSQITILLLAIGYLFKIYFNFLSRKREINHSLYQKMMMDSISDFLVSYSINEQLWRDIPILKIGKGEFTPEELDDMIFKPLNDLKKTINPLRLFFNEIDIEPFEEIEKNMFILNSKVSEIFHAHQLGDNYPNISYHYGSTLDKINDQNRFLISRVRSLVNKKFK